MREMSISTRIRSSSPAAGAAAAPATPRGAGDTFEWDMRKNDGPTDRAFYDCGCGYKFTARVATTVSCPHCGAGQAW